MNMNIKSLILRLKQAEYKRLEANRIKEEIRRLPLTQRIEIVSELRIESNKSDNSDIIDVVNDIINDLRPPKSNG